MTFQQSDQQTDRRRPVVILVPGFWLGAWAWDQVVDRLHEGLVLHAITPIGLDYEADDGHLVTLADRVEQVVALVDELARSSPPALILVGHSGAGPVVQGVVDQRPDVVDRVIYVDTGPLAAGTPMSTVTVEPAPGADRVPLPPWDHWQGEVDALKGLDDATRDEFRRRARPEPAGVIRSEVQLTDPARLRVPATVICTSIPSQQLIRLVTAGHIPSEIAEVDDVTYIDLPTGHWPMFSRPAALATVIADQASHP